jgi:hypothetical protein
MMLDAPTHSHTDLWMDRDRIGVYTAFGVSHSVCARIADVCDTQSGGKYGGCE